MKWIRIRAGQYAFGSGAAPRFRIIKWDEGAKRWQLIGAELIAPVDCYSLKSAKAHAAIVMQQAQAVKERAPA